MRILEKKDIIPSSQLGGEKMSKEIVLEVLTKNAEPLKAGEIAEQGSIEKKEVDKAIKQLKAEGIVVSPKRCFYTVEK
ncbi:MAG: hypothetical protein LBV67_07345 [Streptococcaceae bacterium]|jgi:biotin operon repressor|nr:hypothetical protein [Streptococcaceae bacterium]